MSEKFQCAALVLDEGRWHRFPCQKKATVEEDGKHWCSTHAPSKVAARKAKREQERDRDWAAKKAGWARDEAFRAIAETALAYFDQKASHEDLERAVEAYRKLTAD